MAIGSDDIAGMVRHWLGTPPNGYLGDSRGCDPLSLLHQPSTSGLGDAFIEKMLTDIPILRQLPRNAVNVYFEQVTKDRKRLLIEVGDVTIPYDEIQT